MADGSDGRRGVLHLILPAPDGTRVLARPNGLAGWTLPVLAVDLPFTGWDRETIERAGRVLGVTVTPAAPVGDSAWVLTPDGRVPVVGRAWIGLDEVDRLGADAAIVRAWAGGARDRGA